MPSRPRSYVDRPASLRSLALRFIAIILALAIAATAQGQVKITELGSWGGRINDIAVDGNVMYFHSGGRILIADISDPAAPVELSRLDFRNMTLTIAVRNNILYVGGDPETVCFRTFDVSDPRTPVQLNKFCGTSSSFGVSDIAFRGNIAYTLERFILSAFDVSDPANPVYHGTFGGTLAGPMAVSGDYLFMAEDNANLFVFDLANAPDPFKPPLVAQAPLPSGRENGPIVIQGDYAYVGAWQGDVSVMDISDPLAPVAAGTLANTNSAADLAVSNGVLYVAPLLSNVVKLYDVAGSPASPALLGAITTESTAISLTVSGSTAYVGDEGEGVLIFDASNPASPITLGAVHGPEWLRKEALVGDLLYVTDRWYGFTILDVSDPTHIPMLPIGVHKSGGDENWGIDVQNDLAYLSAGTGGLEILDVAVPSAPVLVGSFSAAPAFTAFDDLAVLDGIAYVGAHCCNPVISFVLTFDVTDPANIILLDTLQTGSGNVAEVEVVDNGVTVIVHALSQGFSPVVVNATDPGALALLSSTGPGSSRGIAIDQSNQLRCTVTSSDEAARGLYFHDVSDPANPAFLSFTQLIPESQSVSCSATSVGGFGNLVCAVACTMHVLDVSNPSAPVRVAESPNFHIQPDLDIWVEGPFMYGVSGINPGGVIIDLVAVPGDFDGDLSVAASDVGGFVGCLLDPAPAQCLVADMDDDGATDGEDISLFLDAILN